MITNFPRSLALLVFLPLVAVLACGTQEDAADSRDDVAAVWEAWQRIDEAYVNREELDPEAVVSGALGSMLDLADAPPYPFLTEVGRIRGQVPPGVPEDLADVWRGLVLHQQRWPDFEQPDLIAATISGIVSGLGDPSAAFLDSESYPQAKENLEESLEGSYLGIGARVVAQDDRILLYPFQDTPAEKAGIQAGDALLAVEGELVAEKSLQDVVDQVAGPEGTKVKLRVERTGEPEPLELEVFRGSISLPSVTSQLVPGGIGYIYVSRFRDNTGEQVYEALEDLKRFDILALILDLRSNPGGSEEAAADVVGQFLPPGSLFLYLEDWHGDRQEQLVRPELNRLELGELPMVVLVNQGTVGEAEAVAAVLQETGLAVLMGTKTFGKGGTYNFIELANGSAIYLPVLRWYTPLGHELGRSGIEPDFPVTYQREDEGLGGETQFNRAYDYLNEQLPPFR